MGRLIRYVRGAKRKAITGLVATMAVAFPGAAFLAGGGALALGNVVVTPSNTQGWNTSDTRPGGEVNYIEDATSPAPTGALQMLTDITATSKAQYMHSSGVQLSAVSNLSYYTKQVTPTDTVADPSYQLAVCLTGVTGSSCNPGLTGTTSTTSSFTTLVFEPYQNSGNNGNAAILNNTWQNWDVDQGLFWSTRTVACSNGIINGTSGGPATYSLSDIQTTCPNAVVGSFGVNIGTNNPGYNVETDLFNFNGTVYDFQLTNVPTDKNQCKDKGFANFTDENGNAFKNQGQCVAYVNRGSRVLHFTINTVRVHNNNNQTAVTGNANSNNNTTGGNATSGNANNSNTTTNNVKTGTF